MRKICGDLLSIRTGAIVHQVNCRGKMAAGLAGAIAERYPQVKWIYQQNCEDLSPRHLLGMLQIIPIRQDFAVVNLFGQDRYGRSGRFTDYNALNKAAIRLNEEHTLGFLIRDWDIYLPWEIGCGLGGGDWDVVQAIFEPYDFTWVEKR